MRLTGFLKGGVSPLGGRREYPIYIDQSSMGIRLCASAPQQLADRHTDLVRHAGQSIDLTE
jgi:hypothetical protein